MNLRTTLSQLAAVATLALTITSSWQSSALAAPDPGLAPAHAVAQHAAAVTKAQQQRVMEYWTPERMLAAVAVEDVQADTAGTSEPTDGGVREVDPDLRFGKVFFKVAGVDYGCSGTATESLHGNVVTTAGHCLHRDGAFATNFLFVPGYHDGYAPQGVMTAKALLTTPQWADSKDFDYDVGFAVVNDPLPGLYTMADLVGGFPIAFNEDRGLTYDVYGYPQDAPYDGLGLYSCHGDAIQSPPGRNGSQGQGVANCPLTGGASGGGWIHEGTLNSVSSFHYESQPDVIWGPYFGDVVKEVFESAQAVA